MSTLEAYLNHIEEPFQRARMTEVMNWVQQNYPQLEAVIKWNQPMFTDHDTFIIGFSMAKHHMSFTPEAYGMTIFSEDVQASGYEQTKGLAKIKWTDDVDYELLKKIIDFNISDKADCKTFFRQ